MTGRANIDISPMAKTSLRHVAPNQDVGSFASAERPLNISS
jgi:hypothetical protein